MTLDSNALGWLFTAIGGGALLGAFFLCMRPLRLIRAGGRASGTVVGVEESYAGRRKAYNPKVKFTAGDGRSFTFTSRVGGGKRPADGETLSVIYDPRQPEEAEIASFGSMWAFPLVLTFFGVPFFLSGLSLLMPS